MVAESHDGADAGTAADVVDDAQHPHASAGDAGSGVAMTDGDGFEFGPDRADSDD